MGKAITKLLGILFFLLFCAAAFLGYDANRFLTTPPEAQGREVVVTIKPGATFDRVAWDLYKLGAITDVDRFRLLGIYKESLGSIRVGDYAVNTGWLPMQVLEHITKGQPVAERLTLREGLTWWETARAVEEQGFATYNDFVEVIHSKEFLLAHAIPFASPEGFLFPDTYHLQKPKTLDKAQAQAIASLLVRTFWKKTLPAWKHLPARPEAAPEGFGSAVADIGEGVEPKTLLSVLALARTINQQEPDAGTMPATEEASAPANATALSADNGTIATAQSNGTLSQVPDAASNSTETISSVTTQVVPATIPAKLPDLPGHIRKKGAVPDTPGNINPKYLKLLVIMASLVEKETGVPAERARVAGVYFNRLKNDMLLQCDPTIIYGIGPNFKGAIRRSQIADAGNKYNTYQNPGLPPGPISSFGLEAFLAAFHPEQHDYLFFVATGLGKDHTFSKTVREHEKAVQVYRSRTR